MKTFYVYFESFEGSKCVHALDINEAYKESRMIWGNDVRSVESA